jgi:transposase-like protein
MSEAKKRKVHSPEFKAKVGLEAMRGVKTINEIGQEYGVHPVQVGQWKKEIQAQASALQHAARPCPAYPGNAVSSTCNRTRSCMSPASISVNPWHSGFEPYSMRRTAPRQSASCARPSRAGALRHPNSPSGPRKISPMASPHSSCRLHCASGYVPPTASNALTPRSNVAPGSLPFSPIPLPACASSPRCSPNAMRIG